jgi:hypothetical protein
MRRWDTDLVVRSRHHDGVSSPQAAQVHLCPPQRIVQRINSACKSI